jgi:uncharacterized protein (DUF111 family)
LRVLSGADKRPLPLLPPFITGKTGYGAGSKDLPVANVLRIRLGSVTDVGQGLQSAAVVAETQQEVVVELSANLDDMTPEWVAYVLDRLLNGGALDAWLTPTVMKKGRPGWVLHVLTRPEMELLLTKLVFLETSTLGVRRLVQSREVLQRHWVSVDTPYGSVRMKVAGRVGEVFNSAPEFEDCVVAATQANVALKVVYQAAWAAYNNILQEPQPSK